MARLRLLHWKETEAAPILELLRQAGHTVDYDAQYAPALLREWRNSPPDVFVIDLSRLPSHSREIAIALRQSPKTCHVPLVFCQGLKQKVQTIREELPDASYCCLLDLASAVRKALKKPLRNPAVPTAMMDRYASRTAAQKLGMAEGSIVRLIEPPRDVAKILGELPPDVQFNEEESTEPATVTLCFTHDCDTLRPAIAKLRELAGKTKLWILWRKKASAAHAGVTEPLVRETGIALGLVDYKICSVNETWSAMLFARKK